jgi:hypothetical protein
MGMGEKKSYVCQNPSCQQTFTVPLKTLNVQSNPTEPYYACPFCLTKLQEPTLKIPKPAAVPSEAAPKKAHSSVDEKPTTCKFHLGYLSERAQKEQIPEDCLLCKSIVECMLKKMRDEK